MSLWDSLRQLWTSEANKLAYVHLDPTHVDRELNPDPLEAGRHYIRLRLAEMHLKADVNRGRTWYPAVHSLVQLQFGSTQTQIPNIIDSTAVAAGKEVSGDVIVRQLPLTPTLPFSGGMITLDAGLVAVQGESYLNNFIQVMGNFAGLLAVPQLSAVLTVATPLANGIDQLLSAGNGKICLGLREAFAATDDIREGYIAAINLPDDDVDENELWVTKSRLRKGSAPDPEQSVAFQEADHMLFRIEIFEERDDWDKLTSINEPYQEAIRYLGEFEDEKAKLFLRRALVRAQQAPELTTAHRRIVTSELKARFRQAQDDLDVDGLVGEDITLADMMVQPGRMTIESALELGAPSLDEALNLDE